MAAQVPCKRQAPQPMGLSAARELPWCPPTWRWSCEQGWGGRVNLKVQIPISWGNFGPFPDSLGFVLQESVQYHLPHAQVTWG